MNSIWTSFSLAWNFLTIIPLPWSSQSNVNPRMLAKSFGWYPFVGFLIGTILVLSDRLFATVLAEPVVSLLLLTVLVILTGGLHQDGLADTIDGVAGGKSPEHRLAILRDGRIGAIGATGLVLALGLRYGGFMNLPSGSRESFLLCMPALGRWSMVVGSWSVSYPRQEDGVAGPFIRHMSFQELLLGTLMIGVGLLWALGPVRGMIVMVAVLILTRLTVWGASRLFGGVTGDILGATNEFTEILFLVTAPLLVLMI